MRSSELRAITTEHLPSSDVPVSTSVVITATATTEISTLSLHDALPIWLARCRVAAHGGIVAHPEHRRRDSQRTASGRSEEHTSELQSLRHLVCRLLLEKKNYASGGARDSGRALEVRVCAGSSLGSSYTD